MKSFLKALVYGGLFIVPFLTLYVANDYFFPFITGKNFAFRIIVEILFASWIILALSEIKYRPKFSWLLSGFGAFLGVMFFANLFGEHPPSSFWSNFERMDGYITLVHVFLYVLVLGSVLTTKKLWSYFLHTTLVAAFIVSMYGLAQYAGVIEDFNKGRIDSYLGNAAYLAIYLLFHIFISFWLFVESRVTWHRVIYGLLAVIFIFTLIETGTRGTVIGLATGMVAMATYTAIFGAKYKEFRRVAVGLLALLLVGAGVFVVGKDSAFVQDNQNLARIANIDLAEDLEVRMTIWGMAWEGVKERPVLGWGQSNFNYIFNAKYDPFLYDQEQWFDRSHNIIMDWLVAGGFLGLLAYLSIFIACIYYLVVVPFRDKDNETFTVLERAVLIGILVGYFTHNLVVFDNIISYIFFALILALIHSRVARPIPAVENVKVDKRIINQVAIPVATVLVIVIIYSLHIPGMRAASDIIDGYGADNPSDRLEAFEKALARDSFAYQEVTEQLAQQAMSIGANNRVPEKIRIDYIQTAERALKELVKKKPNDARIHVFFGSFYSTIGNLKKAEEHTQMARKLSPQKQSIISRQAIIAYNQGNNEEARDYFKEAYFLDKRNTKALGYYLAMLYHTGQGKKVPELIEGKSDKVLKSLAENDFLLKAANDAQANQFLLKMYKIKVEDEPQNEQNWISLSFLYYQMGENDQAVDVLKQSAEVKPSFAKMATCFVDNIEAGREPQVGCVEGLEQ